MTDSKLTYLKPTAPSSCYRGCREGCGCEQPAKEYLASRSNWSLGPVLEPSTVPEHSIDGDVWTECKDGYCRTVPHHRLRITKAACEKLRAGLVGENGKSGEPYTPWFRNLKQAYDAAMTLAFPSPKATPLVHHEGQGGAMACGLKDLDGCMYCSSDDLGDVTCPRCLSQRSEPRPNYGDCANCGKPCHTLQVVTEGLDRDRRLVCSLECARAVALPVGGVGKAQEHPSGLESHKAIREWAEVATRRLKGTAK